MSEENPENSEAENSETENLEIENSENVESEGGIPGTLGKLDQVHRFPMSQRSAIIPLDQIEVSPHQTRRWMDEKLIKELGASIRENGLIESIVVRFKPREDGSLMYDRFLLIAGERRLEAVRRHTDQNAIEVLIMSVNDEEAMKISTEENFRREDLTVIEEIETYIMLFDYQLKNQEDLRVEYLAMGETPVLRLKNLLTKLDSVRKVEGKGNTPSAEALEWCHKFMAPVEEIFSNNISPLRWRSFLENSLPLVLQSNDQVLEAAAQYKLKAFHVRNLNKIAKDFPKDFEKLLKESQANFLLEKESGEEKHHLGKMSGKDIASLYKGFQNKKQKSLQKNVRSQLSPNQYSTILKMKRLGMPELQIQDFLEISPEEVKEALGQEESLKAEVKNRIETGQQEIYEVAKELGLPEILVWAALLDGLDDYHRFQVLGWPRATESFWNYTQSYSGFGDDIFKSNIRGMEEISPVLIAHLLTYFVPVGGMIWVPETYSGVINDTCLAFGRRCRSWNGYNLRLRRPEIEQKSWSLDEITAEDFMWPTSEEKPDLTLVQAEFWAAQIRDSWISSEGDWMRENYKEKLRHFFQQALQNNKKGGKLALLVHEERNSLEHTVGEEAQGWKFGQYEYIKCLEEAGWYCEYSIPCPRPKFSYSNETKKKFQQQLILPEKNRTLLISSPTNINLISTSL